MKKPLYYNSNSNSNPNTNPKPLTLTLELQYSGFSSIYSGYSSPSCYSGPWL